MFQKGKKQNSSISQLDSAPISTVIGADIIFRGDITGGQTIKIDGQIFGNIEVENGIILGEKAVVNGNIKSENIIIYGTIIGNIESKELILKSSGNITGDIDTQIVEIEMGGKYNGKLNMSPHLTISKKEANESKLA